MISSFIVWLCELFVRVAGVPLAMLAIRRVQAKMAADEGIRLMVAVPQVFDDTETVYLGDQDGEEEEPLEAIGFQHPEEEDNG